MCVFLLLLSIRASLLPVRWSNVTLGLACVVENTPYIAYAGNNEFIDIVSRGNCMIGMYCDAQQKVCVQGKVMNEACQADKECVLYMRPQLILILDATRCASYNCLASGVCGYPAEAPRHFGTWVYIVVAVGIFGGA